MDPLVLLPPTTPFAAKGRLFRKEVLRAGVYQHPVEPWDEPLILSNEDIAALAKSSNKAMEAGIRVWVPVGHTNDAEANRGYVREFHAAPSRLEPERMSLYAIMDIRDPDTAEQIRRGEIEDVSVGIEEYGDHRGNRFGVRIGHVALVPDPVFSGQDSFVALSRARGKTMSRRVLAYRSQPMRMKTKRGLSLGTLKPEIVVRKRLSVSPAARKAAKALGIEVPAKRMTQDEFDTFCEAVVAHAAKPAEAGEPVAIRALSRTADATFAELHGERDRALTATVKGLVTSGRIPASVEADVKALLGVRHGYALSAKGEATAVNVRETMEKILSAIPEGAALPIAERLKNLSLAGGQPAGQPEAFDSKKEVEARLASMKSRGLSK